MRRKHELLCVFASAPLMRDKISHRIAVNLVDIRCYICGYNGAYTFFVSGNAGSENEFFQLCKHDFLLISQVQAKAQAQNRNPLYLSRMKPYSDSGRALPEPPSPSRRRADNMRRLPLR